MITDAAAKRSVKPLRGRKARLRVFVRDSFSCQYCGKDLLESADAYREATIDHIVPRSAGGSHRDSNLVACCATCNHLKNGIVVANLDEARSKVDQQRMVVALRYADLLEYLRTVRAKPGWRGPAAPLLLTPRDLAAQLTAMARALEQLGMTPARPACSLLPRAVGRMVSGIVRLFHSFVRGGVQ